MKHLLYAGAATMALTISTNANADNFYVALFGGLSAPAGELAAATSAFASGNRIAQYFNSLTTRTNIYQKSQTTHWQSNLENGWVIGGALGYNFTQGPRIEIEEAYRRVETSGAGLARSIARAHMRLFDGGSFTGSFDPVEIDNFDTTSSGTHSTWSLMANVWYDFEMGPVTPFVGGGVGIAFVDLEYTALEEFEGFVGPIVCDRPDPFADQCPAASSVVAHEITVSDNSWALAYQAGAGLGWQLNESAILSAQYRYFGTGEVNLANEDNSLQSHEILFGINIPFNRR